MSKCKFAHRKWYFRKRLESSNQYSSWHKQKTSSVDIATAGLPEEQIVENITGALPHIISRVPGGCANLRISLSASASDSQIATVVVSEPTKSSRSIHNQNKKAAEDELDAEMAEEGGDDEGWSAEHDAAATAGKVEGDKAEGDRGRRAARNRHDPARQKAQNGGDGADKSRCCCCFADEAQGSCFAGEARNGYCSRVAKGGEGEIVDQLRGEEAELRWERRLW
ncbi:hypothetical protein DFJ73DRAFT_755970 [Zopfochytrium polystomum]|nr:hypothetical protein DFJ73DRAFT_755970 [Zopfochytrium polystomum]